jgi:FAD/FMN-containing dehydrogenase
MATASPTLTTVDELALSFRGELLQPESAGYDDARRVFNAMIDRRPALIARCSGVADVIAALDYARVADLPVAVRGGGHSVGGYGVCEGGLVVDMAPMKGIWIDPKRRVARAQAGLTWGELDRETQLFGLATTGGRVSTTGIGGLILGSGSGWLERKHGLSADNLVSADVVTADGRLLHAAEDENPELFWGLRGGGGNFGIVTSFELRLHRVGPLLLAGMLLHPAERARELVHFYRAFMELAPDEVLSALAFITAPAAPFVPQAMRGKPAVAVVLGWVGDPADGAVALEPMRDFGPPAVDLVQPMPYVALQSMLDDGAGEEGKRQYWKAENLDQLSDDAIDTIVDGALRPSSPLSQVLLIPLGGAYGRVPNDATALGDRDAPWQFHAFGIWHDEAESDRHVAWVRGLARALEPHTRSGIYLNYTSDEGDERVESAYGREKYRRLVALKDEYDPHNVFSLNQNIRPSGG